MVLKFTSIRNDRHQKLYLPPSATYMERIIPLIILYFKLANTNHFMQRKTNRFRYVFCSACPPDFERSVWVSTLCNPVTSPRHACSSGIHYCHQILLSLCHSVFLDYLLSFEEKFVLNWYKYLPRAVFFFFLFKKIKQKNNPKQTKPTSSCKYLGLAEKIHITCWLTSDLAQFKAVVLSLISNISKSFYNR